MSTWQGPGTINLKLSPNSYSISMPDSAIRHLHANHLREFKIRVQGVGVIYDDVENKIGEVKCCETGIGINDDIVTELTRAKLEEVVLSHLTEDQKDELKDLM